MNLDLTNFATAPVFEIAICMDFNANDCILFLSIHFMIYNLTNYVQT